MINMKNVFNYFKLKKVNSDLAESIKNMDLCKANGDIGGMLMYTALTTQLRRRLNEIEKTKSE